ncbi:uncharacterized protein B0H18DRAFT_1032649 [Fomitopsis serialis]|uniref:uncharacterized protein n=1 Tax=Fomitopsis serialis TaxID=139415 RepID=UPI0020072DB6|nr:uncharacterized protein B0H18DRAFT_1032649 [Neoantrodia serialis]KAH9917987.1 hypothetical protein B0H18DRAFT_1032649 [Neoantrodia serialis]
MVTLEFILDGPYTSACLHPIPHTISPYSHMMESCSDSTPVSPPFNDPDADLIIRTSDGVDFRVYKLIMKQASPVFREMFTFPRGSQLNNSVVEVAERSRVWDYILRMLYPVGRAPSAPDPADYWPLLEAAKKYDMAGVREAVKHAMMVPAVLKTDALMTYALACVYGLPDAARAAAKASFQPWPGDGRPPLCIPEMQCMAVMAYHRLSRYRWACVEAATACAESSDLFRSETRWNGKSNVIHWPEWITALQKSTKCGARCPPSRAHKDSGLRAYIDDYIDRSIKSLRVEPSGQVVATTDAIGPILKAANVCFDCSQKIGSDAIVRFANVYAQRIDAAVAMVTLEFRLDGP